MRQTKAGVHSAIHHSRCCHGLRSFFLGATHRFIADPIDHAKDHQLVGEQLHRPRAATTRSLGTGQRNQDRFLLTIEDRSGSRARPVDKRSLDPFVNTPATDSFNRRWTAANGIRHISVTPLLRSQ